MLDYTKNLVYLDSKGKEFLINEWLWNIGDHQCLASYAKIYLEEFIHSQGVVDIISNGN